MVCHFSQVTSIRFVIAVNLDSLFKLSQKDGQIQQTLGQWLSTGGPKHIYQVCHGASTFLEPV